MGPGQGTTAEKGSSIPATPLPGPLHVPGSQFCLRVHVCVFPRSGDASKISDLALTDSFSLLPPPSPPGPPHFPEVVSEIQGLS